VGPRHINSNTIKWVLIDTGRECMDWVHLRKKIHWQAAVKVAMKL